ncbi:glycosyltransferase [Rugosimonospora africana]|uniref:Glycosyl transferase n=1 Tax=Rugosimonospora africana TaxID=556532 RepID=A0A8J3QQ83_9ACTN|nr:glycosyltransferase [Rugosimonospora africana]GIH14943.1 glycosyl transferase [Rugosimonospora africana]
MRVLLATSAGAGHFGPMLPFAAAFRRAGHEVQVAAPGSFAAAVERAGYRHWSCPDADPDEWAAVRDRFLAAEPERRNEVMVTLGAELEARSIMPGMLAAIDGWRPDLILREIGELGSTLAGDLRRVPCAQVLIGLDKFVDFTLPLAAPALAAYRTTLGLDADAEGGYLYRQPSLSLLPPSFEQPRSAPGPLVHRYRAPEPAAAPLPSRWWPDAPLVYATFGTVAGGVPFAAAAFRTVVAVLAELPVRLLVTIGDGGDPDDWAALPPNVHVERWVPQRDVLARAAAMVCHGGTGTVLGGLAAGVPMVVVPQFADQPDNAERVAATGAGIAVGGGEAAPATPDEIRAAVTAVLAEPGYRRDATALAAEIGALPLVDDVVELLADTA